ncbi:twin-arginine translocase subunit TatC [Nocardioides sp.]|uniref:twin-arginine translocase subunit TatC n=1 Tax=Nocardioides sp. TaxID=35761 RepID=UPI002F42C119
MSIVGVVDVLRGKPRNPVGPDGRMALSDHFRELRARLIRSALILVIAFIVAILFYDQLLQLVTHPYNQAQVTLKEKGVVSTLVVQDATGGILLQMKLCGVVALIASSPYWLYQIWAFILPGLHEKEKKYSRLFACVAGPLFIGGVALGYFVLPKGLEVLISFVPKGAVSLLDFTKYFSFLMRMLLVFGIAMEIPLFVVLLNLAGVITGRTLGKHRPWIIIGTMVFAAVATPSTDPFSMLMLAIPMVILFMISEVICRILDRVRGRGTHRTDQWADDEVSPL